MKVDTKGYQGKIEKSATVYSNDPHQPEVKLIMKASVNVPIIIEPKGVMLGGSTEEEIKQTVVVKANQDALLKLDAGTNSLPDKIAYEVKTVKDGREYQIVVRNISKVVDDKYNGSITFKTNYQEQPEITIQCLGYIWKPGTEIPKVEDLKQGSDKPKD